MNSCSVGCSLLLTLGMGMSHSTSTPEASRSDLDTLASSVEAAIAPWKKPGAPGGVVAIAKDGAIVLEVPFGLANLDFSIENAADTVFDIGSTSKQFTAAAVVLLAIEGRLTLDDPLVDHITDLPEIYRGITLRHLLHHTSGIRDYLPLLALNGHPDSDWTTAADALAALREQRGLCFTPGTFHEYSNSGYFLLAQVVERVSGMSFAAFAHERFFAPLGMSDSHVHDDRNRVVARRATSYQPLDNERFGQHTSGYEQTGDGAIMTNVRDLLKWADNFRTGKVGGPEFLTAMGARGALDDGSSLAYGMGLMHATWHSPSGAVAVVSHGGAWVGYRADLLRIPDHEGHGYAIAVLMNRGDGNPSAIAHAIGESIVGAIAPPANQFDSIDLDPDALDPLFGSYRCSMDEDLVVLTGAAGRLVMQHGGRKTTLVAREANKFLRVEDGTGLEFDRLDEGAAPTFTLRTDFGPRRFERFEPWRPTEEELATFVGAYEGDEVEATLEVTRTPEGGLRISLARDLQAVVVPVARHVFEMPGGAFRFSCDASGKPTSCEVRMRGIAGLRFHRR